MKVTKKIGKGNGGKKAKDNDRKKQVKEMMKMMEMVEMKG
jgi:hypothetical protein